MFKLYSSRKSENSIHKDSFNWDLYILLAAPLTVFPASGFLLKPSSKEKVWLPSLLFLLPLTVLTFSFLPFYSTNKHLFIWSVWFQFPMADFMERLKILKLPQFKLHLSPAIRHAVAANHITLSLITKQSCNLLPVLCTVWCYLHFTHTLGLISLLEKITKRTPSSVPFALGSLLYI